MFLGSWNARMQEKETHLSRQSFCCNQCKSNCFCILIWQDNLLRLMILRFFSKVARFLYFDWFLIIIYRCISQQITWNIHLMLNHLYNIKYHLIYISNYRNKRLVIVVFPQEFMLISFRLCVCNLYAKQFFWFFTHFEFYILVFDAGYNK